MTDPVVLIAQFTARPGKEAVVAALLENLADKVRNEPGNVVFDCYQQAGNTQAFVVYEIYRDQRAFDEHISADYGATFNASLQNHIMEPHSVLTFLTPIAEPGGQ